MLEDYYRAHQHCPHSLPGFPTTAAPLALIYKTTLVYSCAEILYFIKVKNLMLLED